MDKFIDQVSLFYMQFLVAPVDLPAPTGIEAGFKFILPPFAKCKVATLKNYVHFCKFNGAPACVPYIGGLDHEH